MLRKMRSRPQQNMRTAVLIWQRTAGNSKASRQGSQDTEQQPAAASKGLASPGQQSLLSVPAQALLQSAAEAAAWAGS
jgi:hypothetical protein